VPDENPGPLPGVFLMTFVMKAVKFENEDFMLSTRLPWQSVAAEQEKLIALAAKEVVRQGSDSADPSLSSEPLRSGGMPNQPFAKKFCKPSCASAETRKVQFSASDSVPWFSWQASGRM